jgi:hypothetical protein
MAVAGLNGSRKPVNNNGCEGASPLCRWRLAQALGAAPLMVLRGGLAAAPMLDLKRGQGASLPVGVWAQSPHPQTAFQINA